MEDNFQFRDVALSGLLSKTSSGNIKLLAAWCGLSFETQIVILNHLKYKASYQLIELALHNQNEYVRYLAAIYSCHSYRNPTEKIIALINNDKSDMVKYAISKVVRDVDYNIVYDDKYNDVNIFLSLSRDEQVILLSSGYLFNCTEFVNVLKKIIIGGEADYSHIRDLMIEYFSNSEYVVFENGWRVLQQKKEDLLLLWEFILESDPKLFVGINLIKLIPFESNDGEYVPEELLFNLDSGLLSDFLFRADVDYTGLRSKIFFSSKENYSIRLRGAAGSCNLNIGDSYFEQLISSGTIKEIIPLLVLARYHYDIFYTGLEPVYIEFLQYYRWKNREYFDSIDVKVNDADDTFEYVPRVEFPGFTRPYCGLNHQWNFDNIYIEILKNKNDVYVKNALVRLGMFSLAKEVIEIKLSKDKQRMTYLRSELPEKFKWIPNHAVDDDVWKTFMKFCKVIYRNDYSDYSKYCKNELDRTIELFLLNRIDDDLKIKFNIPKYDGCDLFSINSVKNECVEDKINSLHNDLSFVKDKINGAISAVKGGVIGIVIVYFVIQLGKYFYGS